MRNALLIELDTQVRRLRESLLLALIHEAGLRRSEAIALDVSDYDAISRTLTIRRGRHGHPLAVVVPESVRQALDAWLSVRGRHRGPLICPVLRGGRIRLRRLTYPSKELMQ